METFLNVFNKGLNSDFSLILQPDGTYRYMRNCQLISQDGNNYSIKDCLGNTRIFTINPPYNATYPNIGALPMVICFISFPNKLIVLQTNNQLTGGYLEIGELNFLPYGEGIQPEHVAGNYNDGYIPLYHSKDLNCTMLHRAEGFGYVENELIQRIYWTDNYNEPRVFNVSDPIFKNYFASGSLVNGDQYMVLEGVVEHPVGSGTFYGPGLTSGNVFTASTATYTATSGTAPTPKIIKYFPYQLLNFNPDRALGTIKFNQYGTGSVYCGNKMYFYRLLSNSGVNTSWSYGSAPIHVGTQNIATATDNCITTVPYQNFVGGGTSTVLLSSGLSVFVDISNVDTTFDQLELACAEFDQSSTTPRQITIVNRVDIAGNTSLTVEHTGSTNLGTLSLADITLFPASILKCKTISTNKNYILIGNTTERQELDISLSGVTADVLYYPMNVHRDLSGTDSCSISGMIYSGVSPTPGANPAAFSVYPFSRWLVTLGNLTTDTVVYNGTNYITGQVITGVTGVGNSTITFTGAAQVRPCVTLNKYSTFAGSVRVENAIELKATSDSINSCFWDYKSAAVHHHAQGYWGGETYRFGALFYDKKGNPFYVRHLIDYTFPDSLQAGIIRNDEIGNSGEDIYSINPKLIKFSGISIPPSVIDEISGFSIVRAPRDGKVITQGLVTQCSHTGASPDIVKPGAFIPMKFDKDSVKEKVYVYLCPDALCGAPLPGNIGTLGDTMEIASWVEAHDYVGTYVRGEGTVAGSEQVFSKVMENRSNGQDTQTSKITLWGEITENQTLSLGTIGTFSQEMNVDLHTSVVAGTCVTGGDYTLDGHNATGCKKIVFTLDNDFIFDSGSGPGDGYGYTVPGPANVCLDDANKILANYTKTGFSNPYGGTGEAALANTLYISTGHFQPITAAVKLDVFDGVNYTFNDVEVAGGDCFINLVDIGYGLWDNTYTNKYSYAWTFPCEGNANYNLRRGRKTSNSEMYYTGSVTPNSILLLGPGSEIRLEQYEYNPGYSSDTSLVKYPALPVNFINSGQFQARIRYAGEKFIGESVDSFRNFALLDFKDLSAQNGRINNIKVKEDRVVVWQDLSVNTVPILERQLLGAGTGDQTTIGTGGVVDRFDIVSSYTGNQHQWGVVETEYGFAWFDMHRKAFMILGFDGTGLIEVSKVGGLQGFFSEVFLEVIGNAAVNESIILNSQDFADTSDRPLMGTGITGVYDPKNKMTYLTFKFKGQKLIGSDPATLTKDFTIGYLHDRMDRMFVGFFDWFPAIAHNHNQWVFSSNNPKNTNQYVTANYSGLTFAIGDTLPGTDQSEYICKAPVTLTVADDYPNGSSGATYWTKINSTNEIWAHNQPALLNQVTAPDFQYDKFFGRVVDNEVTFVINPVKAGDQSFYVSAWEENTPFNVRYTDITISAGNQTASDTSITTTNRFLRFVFNVMRYTLPLSSTGRIVNTYLLANVKKKNWTGSAPTTVSTSVKILSSVKSFFNFKK